MTSCAHVPKAIALPPHLDRISATESAFRYHPAVLLRSLPSEDLIDLRHDFLSPMNACGDEFVRSWASLRTSEQIIRRLHVETRQNRRPAPMTLLRLSSIPASYALSPLIRYRIVLLLR